VSVSCNITIQQEEEVHLRVVCKNYVEEWDLITVTLCKKLPSLFEAVSVKCQRIFIYHPVTPLVMQEQNLLS
jgi:hypothetical protein